MTFTLSFFIKLGRTPTSSMYIVSGASVRDNEGNQTWEHKTTEELRAYLPITVSLLEYFTIGEWTLLEILRDTIYVGGARIPLRAGNLSWKYIDRQPHG